MALAQETMNPITPALAPGSAQSAIVPLPPVSSPLPGPNEPMTFPIDPSSSSSASTGVAEAGPSRLHDSATSTGKVAKRPLPPHLHAEHAHAHAHTSSHGDKEHVAEGTRTPRPKLLTPSPPGSRRGSAAGAVDAELGVAVPGRLPGEGDLAVLMRTIDFAARKHSCQRRKDVDQSPYINHPIGVSNFLSSTGVTDVRVLQAAVLHDTVEDTHTTLQEIADNFGPDVARIVDECTDNPNLSSQSRKAEQIRTAPYKSKEAQQVKLADKLHNLESIRRCPPVGWTKRRIQAYFVWAKQVTDICSASHPPLGELLSKLYKTAYTRVDGEYFPCHPNECGPFTDEEKDRIDKRLNGLKRGEKVCPNPIFF